jgi:hypothetical protein
MICRDVSRRFSAEQALCKLLIIIFILFCFWILVIFLWI